MRVRIGNSEIEVSRPRDCVETKIDEFIKEMKESAKRTEPGSHPAMAEIKGTVPGTRKKVSAAQFFRRLSPKSDVERFLIAQRGRSSNSLERAGHRSQANGTRFVSYVPCLTLDQLLEAFPPPQFIKIDVEGAEFLLLSHAERVLTTYRPRLYC